MLLKQYFLPLIGATVWLTIVGAGLWHLSAYKHIPGTVVALPNDWPRNTAVRRSQIVPTLVMAVHPRCPCTRATISELERILAQVQGRVHTEILFFRPVDSSPDWCKTDLWASAAVLPGVTVRTDPGGIEAARFGAETSGHCILFAPDGRRLFVGGITPFRGHEGDNAGRTALISLLTRGTQEVETTPVFGCALRSSL